MKFVSAAHLTGGGTIGGDLTISGDLTVSGGGGFAYSEVLTGDMKITNTAASTAFEVEQNTGDGVAALISEGWTSLIISRAVQNIHCLQSAIYPIFLYVKIWNRKGIV